jgi:hypothetical protein
MQKNYMSYIRKKANMQGGQASKLKQSILLELVDKNIRCIMGMLNTYVPHTMTNRVQSYI